MKHFPLSLLVISLVLHGCVAGGSGNGNDNDVQVTTDAPSVDTASVADAGTSDTGGAEDTSEPADGETPEDAVSDTSAVADATVEVDATLEDVAVEDAPQPLPDVEEPEDVPDLVAGCNSEEQDTVMQVNPGSLMDKCQAQCGVGKTWCIVQCFAEATAVSVEGGACFGNTYDCIQDSCAGLCDSLTSEACEKCASDNGCFNSLNECVGMPDPPPPGGLCSPVDLQQVADAGSKLDGSMAKCVDQCNANDFPCIEQCVAEALNISPSCSTCFGMYASCASFQCADDCKDFASGQCQACLEKTGCKAQLQVCFDGGPGGPPDPPEEAACGADDLQIFGGLGAQLKDIITTCWEQCADNDGPNCIAKCLQTNSGLSPECSQCQGATYQCVYDNCYPQCQVDLDAPDCNACVEKSDCLDTGCFGGP